MSNSWKGEKVCGYETASWSTAIRWARWHNSYSLSLWLADATSSSWSLKDWNFNERTLREKRDY